MTNIGRGSRLLARLLARIKLLSSINKVGRATRETLLNRDWAKQNQYFVSCNPTDRANNVSTVQHFIKILEIFLFFIFYNLFFCPGS